MHYFVSAKVSYVIKMYTFIDITKDFFDGNSVGRYNYIRYMLYYNHILK